MVEYESTRSIKGYVDPVVLTNVKIIIIRVESTLFIAQLLRPPPLTLK